MLPLPAGQVGGSLIHKDRCVPEASGVILTAKSSDKIADVGRA
jgi:hypothetical protein